MSATSFSHRREVRLTLTLGTLAVLVLLATRASQPIELNTVGRAICADFATYVNDTKAFANTANSLRERFEAIVWLFRGDPLGTYIRAKVQSCQLELRRLVIVHHYNQRFPDRTQRVVAEEKSKG